MTRSPEKIIGENFEKEDYSWKSYGAPVGNHCPSNYI